MTPPKPEMDENGLSKGIKPDYIKPFQHLFEKKNFNTVTQKSDSMFGTF